MYSYRQNVDEKLEEKINQKDYKRYSYDEIKKLVEEKGERIMEPQKPIKKSLKNIVKKNDKPNPANLFYNLFD